MFQKTFARPRFRPAINVGCLMDISTGKYETGAHGESILNGGISGITGICARPNNYKTALAVYMLAMLRRACHSTHTITYDTEGTLHPTSRFAAVSRYDEYLSTIDYEEDEQFAFTDISQYTGDEFFEAFRTVVNDKGKNEKEHNRTTPFIDSEGKPKSALYPSGSLIDSLSRMTVKSVEAIYDKNSIGESGMNTEAMNNGRAKKQMFNQLPQICARTGTYMFLTAHVKDQIQMEMYPTDKRNLSFMKKDTVLEGVSGGFYSLPNNLWMITGNKPLQNKDKMPEYPWDNSTALQGDTDLSLITMMNLRGKNGMSGLPVSLIVSQSEGILPALSEFHYCKDNNRFGLEGTLQSYYFSLCPDVKLSRTTVRRKLQENPTAQRAAQITSEILQMHHFHRGYPEGLICTPQVLYDDLKAMGYDWEVLLKTRGYWVFSEEESEHELPFLSTMDLLNMRQGTYVPYWMDKAAKDKLDLTKGSGVAPAK